MKTLYRKRPIVVEAYQTSILLEIETLEGTMTASPGDWIVTGIGGEQYPVKAALFYKTFERVEEATE